MGNCSWLTYCCPRINLGFWVGRSNNIKSFVLYMLLIQYLQFVVFFPGGGGSLILLFFCDFCIPLWFTLLLTQLIFSKSFWYNIHSLVSATKLFSVVLWVVDAAYSAIKLFFLIEFSTSLIRQVAPLICFFVFFLFFPQKDLAPFFFIGPIKKLFLEW